MLAGLFALYGAVGLEQLIDGIGNLLYFGIYVESPG